MYWLAGALWLALCPVLLAQEALNNASIEKMTKAGLGDDVIVSMIQSKPGHYDLTADTLVNLKSEGVSEKVLQAMIAKMGTTTPSAPAVRPAPASGDAAAKTNSKIPVGARVVIAPMGGFETYFAAAVLHKKVPVTLTLDKQSAQYFVVSTETEWQGFVYGAGGASAGGTSAYGAAAKSTRGLEAGIMLIDAKSKDVVWAYEVHKNSKGSLVTGTHATRGQQSLAEACAKHLKEFVETGK
jgi:hypothetical protein